MMPVRLSPLLVIAAIACGGAQNPVPVVGPSADISRLAGEWSGEYSSGETGRSGSILFKASGSLAPYTDPGCNCPLHTSFIGRLRGDTLEGVYTSRHEQSSDAQRGRWRVVRSHP